ncbi:MAG: hypothetical protein WDN00_19435 [Limisphaerales bacterium]
MKIERRYADARAVAEENPPKEFLENSRMLNPTLHFIPNHPLAPALRDCLAMLIKELEAGGVPEGFRSPVASGKKRERGSLRTVECLLANIIGLKQSEQDTLALSLQHAAYKGTGLSGTGLVNLVNLGDLLKLWKLKKGYRLKNHSRLSRIYPRRKFDRVIFAALAEGIGDKKDFIYSKPQQLVRLRDNGEDVPASEWNAAHKVDFEKIALLENCLRWFNLVISEYKIETINERLYPALYVVFNNHFAHGGRFYTGRGGHTNLPKSERRTVTFDGQPTVELDFQGLHIRMLYHLAGKEFPSKSDPYATVLKQLGLQPEIIFQKFPSIRDDLKDMLLAFINDKASEKQQVARANRRLFYGQTEKKKERAIRREKIWRKAGLLPLNENSKPSCAHVIQAFKKAHQPIREKFATGCGLQLQNLDAEITRWVMLEMMVSNMDECIPTLPVHDSFITLAQFQRKLRNAMQDAYRFVIRQQTKRADFSFKIPIGKD